MTKDEFIKSWTKTIRNHCDLIDNQVDLIIKPTESDEMIEYVLARLGHIFNRLHSITIKPGRGKNYALQVRITMSDIASIKKEIEIWQTTGIKPEYYND